MSIYQQHNPGSTDNLYLRLKDGDSVKMRIVSEPAIVLYKDGQRPRYAWVVFNHDAKQAQVFGAGTSIYGQIADLVPDWGDPKEFDITVKRKGSGQFDTEYSVVPVRNSVEPTPEQVAECEKVDLINATKGKWLEEYAKDGKLPMPVMSGGDEPHQISGHESSGYDKFKQQGAALRDQKAVNVTFNNGEPLPDYEGEM